MSRRTLAVAGVYAVGLLLLSALFCGLGGVAGTFLGLFSGAYGAATLYWTIALLRGTNQSSRGVVFTLLAFFIKFPLIGLLGYLAYSLGTGPLWCFIAGVVVVYFALIWWAARSDRYSR